MNLEIVELCNGLCILCKEIDLLGCGEKWKFPVVARLASGFDWIAVQKAHSLSPADWTVVTLKCFSSPVGPFCSGESEIWGEASREIQKYFETNPSDTHLMLDTWGWHLSDVGDTIFQRPQLIINRRCWVVFDMFFDKKTLLNMGVPSLHSWRHLSIVLAWYSWCTSHSAAFLSGPRISRWQNTNEEPVHFIFDNMLQEHRFRHGGALHLCIKYFTGNWRFLSQNYAFNG